MSSTTAAVPDVSTIGGNSLSGIRTDQDQSNSHTCTRGSVHAVRRIPDETVVVPCSVTPVSVSEDIALENGDVCCEESDIGVDILRTNGYRLRQKQVGGSSLTCVWICGCVYVRKSGMLKADRCVKN